MKEEQGEEENGKRKKESIEHESVGALGMWLVLWEFFLIVLVF